MTEQPANKSHYATSKRDLSVRNAGWALGLTFAVVVVVAMLFFGVGQEPQREVPAESRTDVAASAERASANAPFPLAVPELGKDWVPRTARYTGDGSGAERWSVQYTSPAGRLVTLTEVGEVTPGLISEMVAGARSEGQMQVGGRSCELYSGTPGDGAGGEGGGDGAGGAGAGGGGAGADGAGDRAQRALVCSGDGYGMVVAGRTSGKELGALAEAAETSISAKG